MRDRGGNRRAADGSRPASGSSASAVDGGRRLPGRECRRRDLEDARPPGRATARVLESDRKLPVPSRSNLPGAWNFPALRMGLSTKGVAKSSAMATTGRRPVSMPTPIPIPGPFGPVEEPAARRAPAAAKDEAPGGMEMGIREVSKPRVRSRAASIRPKGGTGGSGVLPRPAASGPPPISASPPARNVGERFATERANPAQVRPVAPKRRAFSSQLRENRFSRKPCRGKPAATLASLRGRSANFRLILKSSCILLNEYCMPQIHGSSRRLGRRAVREEGRPARRRPFPKRAVRRFRGREREDRSHA